MTAANYKTKVMFYAIDEQDDGIGGTIPVRNFMFDDWVQFERASQNLTLQNGQVVVNGQNTITMRWRSECEALTPECIAVIGGIDLRISSVVHDEFNLFTTILLA